MFSFPIYTFLSSLNDSVIVKLPQFSSIWFFERGGVRILISHDKPYWLIYWRFFSWPTYILFHCSFKQDAAFSLDWTIAKKSIDPALKMECRVMGIAGFFTLPTKPWTQIRKLTHLFYEFWLIIFLGNFTFLYFVLGPIPPSPPTQKTILKS